MPKQRASDVGFCLVDSNADVIADNLIRRIHESAVEMEGEVNRLYRGRLSYDLNAAAKLDLDKAIERLKYMSKTLREVSKAQENIVYLQAAE